MSESPCEPLPEAGWVCHMQVVTSRIHQLEMRRWGEVKMMKNLVASSVICVADWAPCLRFVLLHQAAAQPADDGQVLVQPVPPPSPGRQLPPTPWTKILAETNKQTNLQIPGCHGVHNKQDEASDQVQGHQGAADKLPDLLVPQVLQIRDNAIDKGERDDGLQLLLQLLPIAFHVGHFQRAANGPDDLAPKEAPGRAEREGFVSNLCILEQRIVYEAMTRQKSILKPGLKMMLMPWTLQRNWSLKTFNRNKTLSLSQPLPKWFSKGCSSVNVCHDFHQNNITESVLTIITVKIFNIHSQSQNVIILVKISVRYVCLVLPQIYYQSLNRLSGAL